MILTAEERACNFGMRERTRIFVAFTVSIFWRNGRLSSALVQADRATDLTIQYQARTAKIHLRERAEHPIPVAMFREHEAG